LGIYLIFLIHNFGDDNSDKSYVTQSELNVFDSLILGGVYYYGKFDPFAMIMER